MRFLLFQAATQKIQESAGRLNDSEMATVQGRADVITYTTQAEMSHFHEHRVGDFKGYMQAFLKAQIQFHQQVSQYSSMLHVFSLTYIWN